MCLNAVVLQADTNLLQTTMASRRKKIEQHFDDLEEVYFSTRRIKTLETTGWLGIHVQLVDSF